MAVLCPRCGAQYDVTCFQFGTTVTCDCGQVVRALAPNRARGRPRRGPPAGPAEELRRRADRITSLILYSDLPRVDVAIAIEDLRGYVARHFPDRLDLFERIYEARWQRLREQGWEHDRPA